MRKLLIAAGVLVLLIVAALFALPYLVNVNRYHAQIQSELQKRLNRPVSLGRMHLRMLPLSFRVENAVIGEDPAFPGGKPFAQAQELAVRPEFFPLLRGEVRLNSVELVRPQIELIRDSAGRWNFSTLGQSKPSPAQAAPPSQQPPQQQQAPQPAPSGQEANALSLEHLEIVGGQVAITDLQKKTPRAVYQNIDLRVDGYKPGSSFDFELAARMPGQGEQRVKLEGEAGPLNDASPALTPVKASYDVQQVSIEGLQQFLQVAALQGTSGILSGTGSLENNGGKFKKSGKLRLEQAKLRGINVGYPVEVELDVNGDLATELFQIEKGKLKLGNTPVDITGTLSAAPTPMQMDLRVKTTDASIAEIARLAAAAGVAFNASTDVQGRFTADVRAFGASNKPALEGSVRARDLAISGKDLAQPVRVPAIELNLTPTELRAAPFTASTGGTNVTVEFALAGYAGNAAQVRGALRTNNAQLNELLSIANAYGVSATEGMSGSGPVQIDVKFNGPMKDDAPMNYSGSGKLASASIKVPWLTQAIAVRNADLRFNANSVILENMAAAVGETNAAGTMSIANFKNPNVQFTLRADKFNADQWQKMLVTAPAVPVKASNTLIPRAWAQAPQESVLLRTTGGGSIAVGTLIYDQLTLQDATAQVRLDRGVIRMDPVRAMIYGGQHVGSVIVDLRPTPPVYKVSSRVERVDANKFLSAVSSLDQMLFGLLATNANGQFTGGTSEQIARTLNGNVSLNLADGRVANVNMLQQLASVAQFTNASKAVDPFTKVMRMTGNFNVQNGIARTNDLQAIIEGGKLAATGQIDLAAQTIDMRVMAVLTSDYTNLVGGTRVGGFMQTALANNRGEMVIPVIVTGSLASPKVAPDMQQVAKMKLENLLPSTSNPGQLTTGILGALTGQGQGQGQGKGLGGVVDALTGRRPQQQQQAQPADPNAQGDPNAQQQPQQQNSGNPLSDALGALTGEMQKRQQKKQPPPAEPPK